MSKIKTIKAREILDSRGNPTVEVVCELEGGMDGDTDIVMGRTITDGAIGLASVPSGASTGKYEAIELRDNDESRYRGLGVLKAVENVNIEISQNIVGKDFDQNKLDKFLIQLDGTENKSRLGANAILGVSLSFARAVAKERKVELYEYLGGLVHNTDYKLPQPMFNIINGGKHANSGLDIQEFMIAPIGFDTFRRKVQAGAEIISSLKDILQKKGYAISIGDEGGFAPKLMTNEEAFEHIESAIKSAGYDFENIKIGIDCASSGFYGDGIYRLKIDGKEREMNSGEMIDWYEKLVNEHPVISIEDGLAEDDWFGFENIVRRLGNKIKIVGDDLLVTNIKRIKMAIEKNSVNSVLIKPNQIGSLSETIEAIQMTKEQGWLPFVSHRSGETTDTFISDLAVGLSCGYIKSGSLAREERICKYNRLMEIEDKLSSIKH